MRTRVTTAAALLALLGSLTPSSRAQQTSPRSVVLITNAKVFDGKSDKLSAPTSVLVIGYKIEKIGDNLKAPEKATVIDAGGRTLMPGLIDMHWHAMLVRPTPTEAITWDVGYGNLVAGAEATDTLLRGFTTVRDVGGPVFGLKRAVDEVLSPAPVSIRPALSSLSPVVMATSASRLNCRAPSAARGRAWNRWAPAWSPTAQTRSACVCASNSCWAQPRSS